MIERILLVVLFVFSTFMLFAQRTPSVGSAQEFRSTSTGYIHTLRVDDTHVVMVYKEGISSSDPISAVVGQVDTSTQAITWGTPTTVESSSSLRMSALGFSSTQVIVAYELNGTSGVARVLTVNTGTNSISAVSSTYTFYGTTIDAAFTHSAITMQKLTSSTFAMCFADNSTDNGEVVIGTVTGSTLSFGSAQEWSTGDVNTMWMDTLSSSKIVISWEDDDSSDDQGKAIIGNVSGSTVSFGSEYTFYSNGSSSSVSYTAVKSINNTQFVIAYTRDADNLGYAVVGTVSGTTISYGTATQLAPSDGSSGPRDITICYAYGPTPSDTEVGIAYNNGSTDPSRLIIAKVLGTTITVVRTDFLSTEGDDSWVCNLNPNTLVIGFVDDADSNDPGQAKVVRLTPAMTLGCTMTASISSQTNVACNGESTGSLMVTQSNGTANFDYAWSNGANTSGSSLSTNAITGLVANTYTVTVTDNNGCTATASSAITQPSAALVASASVDSNVTCSGFTDGGATASATGGTTNYTYSWSNGDTTASITGVAAGTYSITITDANGCTDSASTTVNGGVSLVGGSVGP